MKSAGECRNSVQCNRSCRRRVRRRRPHLGSVNRLVDAIGTPLDSIHTYAANCSTVRPQYSLIMAQVSVGAATCQYEQSEMVSGAAVLGGSTRYAALRSGSAAKTNVIEGIIVNVFQLIRYAFD